MKIDETLEVYDEAYAASYDSRFLLLPWAQEVSEFELSVMREVLGEDGSFLDVGCGTGWFLSQFPGRDRAGLDISPAMLARARGRNPDAEFRQGDFKDDQPDWHDRWDLVSCMWFAYCYAETVDDIERLIANMARWTSPTGAVFLPVCDTKALGLDPYHLTNFPYKSVVGHFGGLMNFTSITWTWEEPGSGRYHRNLVSPHEEHLIAVFSRHFREVGIQHYPEVLLDIGDEKPWVWNRKAILAKHKRVNGDTAPSQVVVHRAPGEADAGTEIPCTPSSHPPAIPQDDDIDAAASQNQSASTPVTPDHTGAQAPNGDRPLSTGQRGLRRQFALLARKGLLRGLRTVDSWLED